MNARLTLPRCARSLFAFLGITVAVATQTPAPANPTPPASSASPSAALDAEAVKILTSFAKGAETYKAFSFSRAAWSMLRDHYDSTNRGALQGLGFREVKGEWQAPPTNAKPPADAATPPQRTTLDGNWRGVLKRLGKMHRELAVSLQRSGDQAQSRTHFERAVELDPDDAVAHDALGHENLDGFRGNAEQIAFVKRMRELQKKAKEIAATDIPATDLSPSTMPAELAASKLPFVGAQSTNYTYWITGTPAEARAAVAWSERSNLLFDHILGDDSRLELIRKPRRWIAVVRGPEERDVLMNASPVLRGKFSEAEVKMFGGIHATLGTGTVEVWWHRPEVDADNAVGLATKRGICANKNGALGEGLVHTATWLLCGTTETGFASLASTSTGKKEPRERDPSQWVAKLRTEIGAGTDWPLVSVPRERMDNFRDPVRYKAWSFMTWLVCRHPDRWPVLMKKLARDPLTEEEVVDAFDTALGRPIGDVEAEWREWARPGSRIGKASFDVK